MWDDPKDVIEFAIRSAFHSYPKEDDHKSAKETVKTIARGMPGVFRCDRGD
jgi:hypothetical protein